jgi:dTDP-4-amino-4,6-dideoxygalactose transaminase
LDAIIAERRAQAQRYTGLLDALGFVPQQSDPDAYHNMQSVVFVTPPDIRREALSDWLRTQDIETTLGTYSLSATTYYRQKYDDVQANSLYLQSNTISLPCYRDVPIDYVCERIAEYMTLSPSYKTYG